MHPRIDTTRISPGAYKAMRGLESYVDATSLEPSLRELVNIRASQINACTLCLHMHLRDARKAGESQERLDLIGAWREAPVFSERERAALAWTGRPCWRASDKRSFLRFLDHLAKPPKKSGVPSLENLS